MLTLGPLEHPQIPLIHVIHDDDVSLQHCIDGVWFTILHDFVWQDYRDIAAAYYDALYAFNRRGVKRDENEPINPESTAQAKQRLLFDRPTMRMDDEVPPVILYQQEAVAPVEVKTDPLSLFPGEVPNRLAGRKPKCFFSLFKSFIGASLMGFKAEPEQVDLLLNSHPSFARLGGFSPKESLFTGTRFTQTRTI